MNFLFIEVALFESTNPDNVGVSKGQFCRRVDFKKYEAGQVT